MRGSLAAAFVSATALPLSAFAFDLTATPASPAPLGTPITWSVTGDPPNPDDRVSVRLSVKSAGADAKIVYDYTEKRDLNWTPMSEGAYVISATVKDLDSGQTTLLQKSFVAQPRARGNFPVVSATAHPLVALYSAPACTAGDTLEVTFAASGDGKTYATNRQTCDGTKTMNFLIGGMRPVTTYALRDVERNANGIPVARGPQRSFTTGVASTDVPVVTVAVPPGAGASTDDRVLIGGPIGGVGTIFATDLTGVPIWYYTAVDQSTSLFTNLLRGGDILMITPTGGRDRFELREVDLASNNVRVTNAQRVSDQLRAMGFPPIGSLHHEARLLPNGQIVTLGSVEQLLRDVQGPGVVDVLGDIVIALDENLQVVWASNLFDVLDPHRAAILGETCVSNGPGCPPLFFDDIANDWLHSNAVAYSPRDHNLIVSHRHQDWLTKLDYQDGAGTGAGLWEFGRDGDFTLTGAQADDGWFSHQHDAHYLGLNQIIMFDNGNANPDCLADPTLCHSSGRVYEIDDAARTATPVLAANLQNFSFAVGASEKLSNGNYHFNSGIYAGGGTSHSTEVDAQGNVVFDLAVNTRIYRSYRVTDLYSPPK